MLDGDGSPLLLLPAAPFTTIIVEVDGVAVTDFLTSRRAGILRRVGGYWPDGLENIEVKYTHGYATVPGAIQDAVLEMAMIQLTAPVGVQQESAGGQSVTWGLQATTGVTQRWTDAVEAYRLRGGRS
jgi:hypothetical protein